MIEKERAKERERNEDCNCGQNEEAKTRREAASNVRLDDLSTYEKIAFYKLVSRKELEGIADESG